MVEREKADELKELFPILGQTLNITKSLLGAMEEFGKTGLPEVYEHKYGHAPTEEELASWRLRPREALRYDLIDFFYSDAIRYSKETLNNDIHTVNLLQQTAEYGFFDPSGRNDRERVAREDSQRIQRRSEKINRLQAEYKEFTAKRGAQLPLS